MIKVPKGQSAKTDGTLDDTMALKIIEEIRSKPDITLDQLSEVVVLVHKEPPCKAPTLPSSVAGSGKSTKHRRN